MNRKTDLPQVYLDEDFLNRVQVQRQIYRQISNDDEKEDLLKQFKSFLEKGSNLIFYKKKQKSNRDFYAFSGNRNKFVRAEVKAKINFNGEDNSTLNTINIEFNALLKQPNLSPFSLFINSSLSNWECDNLQKECGYLIFNAPLIPRSNECDFSRVFLYFSRLVDRAPKNYKIDGIRQVFSKKKGGSVTCNSMIICDNFSISKKDGREYTLKILQELIPNNLNCGFQLAYLFNSKKCGIPNEIDDFFNDIIAIGKRKQTKVIISVNCSPKKIKKVFGQKLEEGRQCNFFHNRKIITNYQCFNFSDSLDNAVGDVFFSSITSGFKNFLRFYTEGYYKATKNCPEDNYFHYNIDTPELKIYNRLIEFYDNMLP